ncbi:MAG TPA: methyltransferase [Flavobacterium sp.]|jgi:tRNA1Val (adenine37-N6)-methyltransferase
MSFKFKHFTINQDKTAMKVGTDGVLLGAWTPIPKNCFSILDIGTGTGLIALMLAQRTSIEHSNLKSEQVQQIDALEIDENAYEQAVDNFESSPWAERLFCYHASLEELIEEPEDVYDLIISNPPFYTEDYRSGDESRDKARFSEAMPFEQLIEAADLMLSDEGIFSVIIPFKEELNFIKIAARCDFFPQKITRVKGTSETEIKRSLIALTREKEDIVNIDELVIETERHQYSLEYIRLTKDFYLKM